LALRTRKVIDFIDNGSSIGSDETAGVVVVLLGLYEPRLKSLGIIFLLPFAIGALTAHFAHQDYRYYYDALTLCILSVFLAWTDPRFKIVIE
jgi:uncharacterized membrane protein YphA (DoxX/SURF4 family)